MEAPCKGAGRRVALPLRVSLAGAALLAVMLAPQPWLKAVAALLVLALAVWDAEPWVYLAAFCIPFSFVRVAAGPLLFSPADVTVWAAAVGAGAAWLLRGRESYGARRWIGADMAVIFLLLAGAASLLVARDLIAGLDGYRLLILQPALLYAVVRFGGLTQTRLNRLADAFVLGGVALALAGLWQYAGPGFVEQADGVKRLLVPFYDSPNHIALYLGRVGAVAFGVAAFAASQPRRWLHAAAFGVILLAFTLTYSRAGWLLGLPAAAVTVALFAGRRRLAATLTVIALAVVVLLPLLGAPRFGSLLALDDGTAESRLLIWRGTARMIIAHPLLGVGIGNYYTNYPQYMLPEAWHEPLLYHAHNAALDFWSMLGIGGLAAFVWLEAAFWGMALRLRRVPLSPDARALLIGAAAGMVYALAHGLVDTLYFLPDLALAFMLTLGMVAALGDGQDLQDEQDLFGSAKS